MTLFLSGDRVGNKNINVWCLARQMRKIPEFYDVQFVMWGLNFWTQGSLNTPLVSLMADKRNTTRKSPTTEFSLLCCPSWEAKRIKLKPKRRREKVRGQANPQICLHSSRRCKQEMNPNLSPALKRPHKSWKWRRAGSVYTANWVSESPSTFTATHHHQGEEVRAAGSQHLLWFLKS